MSEYCVNCEATQRKLDFYVEQFNRVEEERNWLKKALVNIVGYADDLHETQHIAKEALILFKEPSDNG